MKTVSRRMPVDALAEGVTKAGRSLAAGLSALPRLETALLIGLFMVVRRQERSHPFL